MIKTIAFQIGTSRAVPLLSAAFLVAYGFYVVFRLPKLVRQRKAEGRPMFLAEENIPWMVRLGKIMVVCGIVAIILSILQ